MGTCVPDHPPHARATVHSPHPQGTLHPASLPLRMLPKAHPPTHRPPSHPVHSFRNKYSALIYIFFPSKQYFLGQHLNYRTFRRYRLAERKVYWTLKGPSSCFNKHELTTDLISALFPSTPPPWPSLFWSKSLALGSFAELPVSHWDIQLYLVFQFHVSHQKPHPKLLSSHSRHTESLVSPQGILVHTPRNSPGSLPLISIWRHGAPSTAAPPTPTYTQDRLRHTDCCL